MTSPPMARLVLGIVALAISRDRSGPSRGG
jgi:hypothetical protein